MSLTRKTYTPGNRFIVMVGGVKLGFSKVQGLKQSAELTPVREGGLNGWVHMLPASAQQNGRVTFEQGWCGSLSEAVLLKPGNYIPLGISVEVQSPGGSTAGLFYLNDPVIESWEMSDLSALESSVLIKKLSVIHCGIDEVPASI